MEVPVDPSLVAYEPPLISVKEAYVTTGCPAVLNPPDAWIYPVTTQRLAMKNVEDGLRAIFADGHQNNIIDKMQTRKRLYDLVEYEKYNSLDEKIYNFNTDGHE